MSLKQFLEFVEIRTKLASVLPFVFGSLFVVYSGKGQGSFNTLNFILMFTSLIFIDMTTTAINNYLDYSKSKVDEFRTKENVIGVEKLDIEIAKKSIFATLAVAIIFGICLAIRTSGVVLVIGGVSFIVGITYTYGPVPISRTPYGEVVSGFFMGFVILLLSVIIHSKEVVWIQYSTGIFLIGVDLLLIIKLFFISLPFVLCIGNVMLANNICDLEMDRLHQRFLLPHYIGKKVAIKIFEINYYIAYVIMIACMIFKILPITIIVSLLSFPIVRKNIEGFKKEQVKNKTFVLAVRNLMVISLGYIIGLTIAVVAIVVIN